MQAGLEQARDDPQGWDRRVAGPVSCMDRRAGKRILRRRLGAAPLLQAHRISASEMPLGEEVSDLDATKPPGFGHREL